MCYNYIWFRFYRKQHIIIFILCLVGTRREHYQTHFTHQFLSVLHLYFTQWALNRKKKPMKMCVIEVARLLQRLKSTFFEKNILNLNGFQPFSIVIFFPKMLILAFKTNFFQISVDCDTSIENFQRASGQRHSALKLENQFNKELLNKCERDNKIVSARVLEGCNFITTQALMQQLYYQVLSRTLFNHLRIEQFLIQVPSDVKHKC